MAEIKDLQEPWDGVHNGNEVEAFIKSQFRDLLALNGGKIGDVKFVDGSLVFYDEEGGNVLSSISLSGSTYTIKIESDTPSQFYCLTSENSKIISMLPSTTEGSVGSQDVHDFPEDYNWELAVDSGSGFVVRKTGSCLNDQSFSVDIRPYLTTGSNRVRVYVTGVESGQTRSVIYNVSLTSLSLNVNHAWQNAWIGGQEYGINGIKFSGAIQKTLNVLVDGEHLYQQTFAASVRYETTTFTYDMTDKFPSGTGVHTVDVWLSGEGVETTHYLYNIMCVEPEEQATAKLACINAVQDKVTNYMSSNLFSFATYGTPNAVLDIVAHDSKGSYDVVKNAGLEVVIGTKNVYNTRVEVPTEEENGVSLDITLSVDGFFTKAAIEVDNSESFPAATGAVFYMNAALRSNSEDASQREKMINSIDGQEYAAVTTNFAWANDGWARDNRGIKCLYVQAGSVFNVDGIRPTGLVASKDTTLEFKFKTSNIADYDTPIMSLMTTEEYESGRTNGLIIYPTKIALMTSQERNMVQQSVNFTEDEYMHCVIAFHKDYNSTGKNLCRVYLNGVPQCNFTYQGELGAGSLKIGQHSADICLYMLRWYDKALEHDSVLKNWLNCLNDREEAESGKTRKGVLADNDVISGNSVDYSLVKKAGFNTMVIETGYDYIPDLDHNQSIPDSTLMVEFADSPEKNFIITHAPLDGQGTTSMKYYRWNLRWKCNDDTRWLYPNAKTAGTSKAGWFDGENVHPKVSKITAKKNVASSGQGHKMGATALYNDLYEHIKVGIKSDKPDGTRVAVYQYPVVGFLKVGDEYRYIGLYTIGPDKGDSKTFGYDGDKYPSFLSLEGPNHAPLGTRFLHPWFDVDYDNAEETITFGNQEGWDVDACPYDTKKNKQEILDLATAQWKPAYGFVYFCSPYLASLSEIGMTLGELNAMDEESMLAFRNSMDVLGNRRNECLTLYDANYNLIYYRQATRKYAVLSGHNVKDYVADYLETDNPSTADLIEARKRKFHEEAQNYFNIGSATFHACFMFLIGGTDNDAKNTYPFIFRLLEEGGRWEWRQDDTDTILPTDNNGSSTKDYSIEPADLVDGVDVFQGSSSVFWTLIRDVFAQECKDMMMSHIVEAMKDIAAERGISAGSTWATVFNVFGHYFWDRSANYFPATLYDEDTMFAYISVWLKDTTKTYNGVAPLTQALGTQLEAEQQWALRRIIYTLSKYEIAGFTGSDADGLGALEFTPASPFDFHITPAMDLYPSGNRGGGENVHGTRTKAGEECIIRASSDGTTTFYIKALDWLNSLGDLSGLKLTSRGGGDTSIVFSVKSKRMRDLKVGDENPENVQFNANTLQVSGESFEEIDGRNTKFLNSPVDLKQLPRLRKALFEGSSATGLSLPVGAKVEEVSLPDNTKELFLHSLPLLDNEGMTLTPEVLKSIEKLYYYECKNISPVEILRSILSTEDNRLRFVSLISTTQQEVTGADINLLTKLAEPMDETQTSGYGRMLYNNENDTLSTDASRLPDLQGTFHTPVAGEAAIKKLEQAFPALHILADKLGISFADPEVERVLLASPLTNPDGDDIISTAEAEAATSLPSFYNNSEIESFDELEMFKNVKSLFDSQFDGCSNLKTISLDNIESISEYGFRNALDNAIISLPNLKNIQRESFFGSGVKRIESLGEITSLPKSAAGWPRGVFANCINLEYVNLPETIQSLSDGTFYGSKSGIVVNLPKSIKSIGRAAFMNCNIGDEINLPNLESLAYEAFLGTTVTKITSLGKVASISSYNSGMPLFPMNRYTVVVLPETLTNIGMYTFQNSVIQNLVCKSLIPATLHGRGFWSTTIELVYVPDGSVDAYKSADGWSAYAGKIKGFSEAPAEMREEYGF